jgi:curli production assembly/transport component CsgF
MFKYLLLILLPSLLLGSEIVFEFKSPTFNGVGYSSHQLSKEQISFNRRKSIADEIKSIALQAELAESRSATNQFMSSLQARIYSELAKQITDQLFSDDGQESGTFTIEDSTINWYKSADDKIVFSVTDLSTGDITEIIIPIGSLYIPTTTDETGN